LTQHTQTRQGSSQQNVAEIPKDNRHARFFQLNNQLTVFPRSVKKKKKKKQTSIFQSKKILTKEGGGDESKKKKKIYYGCT
ncbi:hypothetical protein, partial [Morganella morganii]|uniref:hypothetical protein n=1 Tax=Morganella morganii TaxID=582 RepID=UPI001C70BEE7